MFEPFQTFQKSSYHFCFRASKFSLFYTFIQKKGDKYFVRFTAIIIFPQRRDTVFSLYCATQGKKGILDNERNRKDAYTTRDVYTIYFVEKAPHCFEEHHQTHRHKNAASYHVVIPKCKDVGEMTNHNLVSVCEKERKYLRDVIRC